MKGFFSRLNGDIQASSSKPTKESSYKFWIPSNTNAEKSPPKTIPVHPDVAASRSRPLKSAHPPKIPLHDLPTAPLETQAIHTNGMSRYTSRPNPGTSSTPYSQNHLPPPSRTPRPHEHNDTRYQAPSRETHVPAYPTGSHTLRETSSKLHRGERRESVAPVPREIWLPPTTPAVSKQVEGQREPHVRGTSEKPDQYGESGDNRDRVKELDRRGKDRDRDRREKERERERGEKGRTREHEREERERRHAKERQEREVARAKREEDRNLEIDRRRERDKYAHRDQRDLERDSDREGKNRTKDRSRKESSNLTKGMERAWDSDVPYDGERTKQDERKAHRRDRTTGGVGKGDNRESHKERARWLEKEPERARERLGGQIKHRSEATDGEQFTGRVKTPAPAPDRETRKDSGVGWFSDTHTGHSRKLLRKTSNTLLNQPARAEGGGDSSDSSTRPNRVPQVLKKRQRGEEGGSSSKIIHSRQGMPTEPLASTTKSSVVKATSVTIPDDVHLPVPPTPQHMPIYLPPKESTGNAIDSSLPLNIAPLNVVSTRAAEARETVNRLKSHDPPTHTENVSNPREVDTSVVRRPPSRGPTQPPNPIPSHPMVAPSVKGTRGSAYSHRPKYSHPIPTIVHDKLQTPGLSLLPEMPHTSAQAEGSKDPNRSLERLPDSIPKKEVPSVFYKVQHRIPPQGAGADSSRHPTASTPQNVARLSSTDLASPNLDPELSRRVTHSFLHQGGSNVQTPAETNPSYNLQLHNRAPTVMSGNSVVHEAHLRMGTPVAQVVLGKAEPMNPPSDTTMQKLQSAPLNLNVIQDSGISSSVLKTNKIEAVTQPKNEVSLSSIERSQFYTELSINRPSTAMDCKSLGKNLAARPHLSQDTDISKAYPLLPGWRNNVNIISNTLSDQEKSQVATASGIALNSKIPPSMSNQSRSNGQESIGIAITRPSTTTGFRQSTAGKNLRHHNISLSHSDAQNSIGISIPRPSTATAIKQSSSGPSPRQTFNATPHILNPVVEEAHSNIFSPSIAKHDSILAPNPQPVTLSITEKGSGLPAQPYNMTPSAGLSLGRGDAIVLQEDVTGQQGASGSHRQGHADGAGDLNVISYPENFTSQTSTVLNPKLDNLRNATTPLAGSILPSNDNVVKIHSTSMSTHGQDSRGGSDHFPTGQNLHQASKENSIVPQCTTLASANHDNTGNNNIPTTVNAKASTAQPITLSSGVIAPQIQIQRPSTSHQAFRENNTVTAQAPSSFTAPQIQIQRPSTSHQAFKENGVVLQRAALASVNNDCTENNIAPITLNAKASSAEPITLPSSFTAPRIQIQRPLTSHQVFKENSTVSQRPTLASNNNDSTGYNIIPTVLNAKAPSAQPITLPSSLTDPQIQIQRPPTSHQASKENGIVPQRSTLASVNNNSTGHNIIPTSLNVKASSTQSTLSSSFTTPHIQIQRPPSSLSTRNNSVPSASPSAVIVPQIQIHHLITTTGTENKSESLHTEFHADASMPCIPGVGAGLEMPVVKRLATPNPTPKVFPIQIDQPQLHRPVHVVPTSMTDANDVRPSINERTLTSHAEDSRFKTLRVGSSQEVTSQTVVNNHSATLPSYQSDPASSATVQNVILNMQMDNDLAQASPSLGFFNNTFSEALHSHVARRSGQGDYMATKVNGKIVSADFETDKDVKTSESLVNRDTVRNVLPKEPPDVPSVERLMTQKDSHTDIHSSKVALPRIPSEVNRSSKSPSPPSHPRIQHPGLAEILFSPFNNDQPPSLSAAHHQSSTVFSKSGSSPKLQGSLDKQRPDDKLVSPKSSFSRQLPSDLRHKEVEQHHESSKRQQQTATTTSRSAHLEILLSDPHVSDSLNLTSANAPSSSHPSTEHQPRTTSTIPDGITPRFLESTPHVNSKRPGQSGASYPEVPINTGGPPQMDELVSRKIQPPSIVDSKPLGNGMTHYRAATPLRESTSTTRHQHSMSLPVHLVPAANVPSADGPLRAASHIPLNHHSTSQTKPGYTRPPDPQTLAPNKTSDPEETILMTPSSLARSVKLKPTVSRQSVTPSISSQKGTGLFTMFRSRTPAQPRPQYEIWHPNASSKTPDPNVASSDTLPEQKKTSAPTPVPVISAPIAIERSSEKSKIFTPFRYLTTKRNRAVSLVSVEAQDGTAPSTIVGSPTASMLSQAPFQPPPVRDPMQATAEWRHKEEETYSSGKPRIQRPGVVFDVAEDRPDSDRRQRPKRTRTRHKSSRNPS